MSEHVACETMRQLSNTNLQQCENSFSHSRKLVLLIIGNLLISNTASSWIALSFCSFVLMSKKLFFNSVFKLKSLANRTPRGKSFSTYNCFLII